MKLPLLLTFSFLFLVSLLNFSFGQEQKAVQDSIQSEDIPFEIKPSELDETQEAIPDTTETDNLTVVENQDTVESVPLAPPEPVSFFNSFGIGVDYGKLLAPLMDLGTRYELMADFEFKKKVSLIVDYGSYSWETENAIRNGSYLVEGNYFRAGLAYFISHQDNNRVYTGILVGSANFQDQGTFLIQSRLWDDYSGSFSRPAMEALWLEWIFGTEGELFAGFSWGWIFRLRFMQDYQIGGMAAANVDQPFEVHNIPGYGKPAGNVVPAMNLILKYNLNF